MRTIAIVTSILIAAAALRADAPTDAARRTESERIAAIDRVRPAVVAIFAGGGGGSGVLIDPEGYALTNFHVVQGAGPVLQCGLPDGVLYDAVLVGLDKVGDVALIKLLPKQPGKPFPAAPLGDSDQVRVGDWSLAMGNPFLLATDFTPTVTFGLVSGTHRYQRPEGGVLLEYTDCIQVDASINPGNSGGPLFNAAGELIGINGRGSFEKRGRVNSGVGYAISIDQIKNFLGHLYAGLDADHATLGATVKTVEEGDVSRMAVQSVLEESDAARRGLQPDDELVEFAGRPMASVNQYKNVLGIYPKGWRLPLVYRRDNQKHEILVRLMGVLPKGGIEDRPERPPSPQPRPGRPGRPGGPPQPKPKGPVPNAEALKLYKAKKGFANFYFNELARQKLLSAFTKHGDFSGLVGNWTVEGEIERKQAHSPARWEVVEQPAAGDQGPKTLAKINLAGLEFTLDPLKSNPDVRDLKDPPGSGGLLMALYHYRRLLTLGAKGFEGDFSHGGVEPLYPPPAPGVAAKSPKDTRVDAEVLHTEHAAVPAQWYFDKSDGKLLGFEVFVAKDEDPCEVYLSDYRPVDGRQLPHRLEVRHGDETFGVLTVKGYHLSAK